MTSPAIDTFWSAQPNLLAVERRLLYQRGNRRREVTISIAPDQAVPALSQLSEQLLTEQAVPAAELSKQHVLTPQLVFAEIKEVADELVAGSASIDLPVIQVGPVKQHDTDLTIAAQMARAKAAMPTAAVAAGDHAAGWLIKDRQIRFYPLIAVSLPEELESYQDGLGTSNDVIAALPFQA